jgi:hypothetical protein
LDSNITQSGPFLTRDMAAFYFALDISLMPLKNLFLTRLGAGLIAIKCAAVP